MIQITGTSASILWLRRDAQESKISHFPPEGANIPADEQEVKLCPQRRSLFNLLEVIQLINFLGMWRKLLLEEVESDFPQLLTLLTQAIHGIVDGIVGEGATPWCSGCQLTSSVLQQSVAIFGNKSQRHFGRRADKYYLIVDQVLPQMAEWPVATGGNEVATLARSQAVIDIHT